MTDVCHHCGLEAPPQDARDAASWRATTRADGTVELSCPACLARIEEDAIDEGLVWSDIERLPPEGLGG